MPKWLRSLLALIVSVMLAVIWGFVGAQLGFPSFVVSIGAIVIVGVVLVLTMAP